MLSMEIEYRILKKKKKKKVKTFQNIVTIFKINSTDARFFYFRASKICSRSLLISCAIIVVFSTRIFQNLDLGIELGFKM